ncbi:MAG: phage major capsid protein [Clostridiales bacterium]|nr:phage major capsid protein [Clostridiales bacterium]MDY3061138.1 phage major capsid protein [Eubacteriales bacterium]
MSTLSTVTATGNLFPEVLVADLISKVKGRSSLAVLSQQTPIPFNGSKEFVFSMDSEIDIVAENGKKTPGGLKLEPYIVRPIKVEYGARVSDEFLYASEEARVSILQAFNDGFAKKLAKGLDWMAMHGINPRTGTASEVIGTNHFDGKVTQTAQFNAADPEAAIEAAVALVQAAEGDVNGLIMSSVVSSALAKIKVNGVKQYPSLAWGANPGELNGLRAEVNNTVAKGDTDVALLGDFGNGFKWGYAKEVIFDMIKYGDPDNTGKDLRGYNQVYLRAESFLGWSVLLPEHFARITKGA